MMYIVIDTNILYEDLGLQRQVFAVLKDAKDALEATIVIPWVVFEEAAGIHKRQIQEKTAKAINGLRKLADAGINVPKDTLAQINEQSTSVIESYRKRLLTRSQVLNAKIAPCPAVSHESLVLRATERRRPFQESGKGYRDTLLWFTVLATAKEHPESTVLLVTKNTEDFGAGGLHADLLQDLSLEDRECGRVRLVEGIKALNDAYVAEAYADLASFRDRFNNGAIDKSSLEERIAATVTGRLEMDLLDGMDHDGDQVSDTSIDGASVGDIISDEVYRQNGDIGVSGYVEVVARGGCRVAPSALDYDRSYTASFRCSVEVGWVAWYERESESLVDADVYEIGRPRFTIDNDWE